VLGVPTGASDVGLQNIGVSCTDWTELGLALDAAAVTQLSDAVAAINLYPAGDPALACESTPSSSSGSSTKDYVVGGGQGSIPCLDRPAHPTTSLSAHVESGSLTQGIGGTFNTMVPEQPGCVERGSLVAKVDCLQVIGNHADLTAEVTKSSGSFADIQPGDEIAFSVTDNSPLAADTIGGDVTSGPCAFVFLEGPIERGNFSVHDAP
jgi:hypothetical protein